MRVGMDSSSAAAGARGRFSGALLLAALILPAISPDISQAAPRSSGADLRVAGPSARADASGRIRYRERGDRERLRLSVRGLTPGTAYEVRAATTDAPLAGFTTNRRGRGKVRIHAPGGADPTATRLGGLEIEVREAGFRDPILEGRVPGARPAPGSGDGGVEPRADDGAPDDGGGSGDTPYEYSYGFLPLAADHGTWGELMLGSMVSCGDEEFLSATVAGPGLEGPLSLALADAAGRLAVVALFETASAADDPIRAFVLYASNRTGGLPHGAREAAELSQRAFEIRDAGGRVLFAGRTPVLELADPSLGSGHGSGTTTEVR